VSHFAAGLRVRNTVTMIIVSGSYRDVSMSRWLMGFFASASLGALLATPSVSYGQERPKRFELTPYGGFRFGGTFESQDDDDSVALDDHASAGLIFNLREGSQTQWEVIYSHQRTTGDTAGLTGFAPSTDFEIDYLQGGGTYLGLADGVRPFVAMTLGGARVSPQAPELDSDTFWSFSIGGGLQLQPSARIGIRLEARAWGTLIESDTRLFCRSGFEGAFCAIRVEGTVLWQLETFAGVVFRF
jgi:hypothetical protein